jgi:hypothetical protein
MLSRILALHVEGPVSKYEWTFDGVYSVRPARFRNNRGVALNRVVASFESHTTNVMNALFDVHRIFDGDYATGSRPPRRMPDRIRPFVERDVRVSMAQASVRSILNEICRQHGAMSWLAEYGDASGGSTGLKLTFVGFDKWTVSASAGR